MSHIRRFSRYFCFILVILLTLSQETEGRRKILRGRKTISRWYMRESAIPAWAVVILVAIGQVAIGGLLYVLMKYLPGTSTFTMSICNEDKIKSLESEIRKLETELQSKRKKIQDLKQQKQENVNNLSTDEIVRYSRQMLLSEIQVYGQMALKTSKVLIVGVGGLGCPAALYLTSAGVGQITLLDYDEVELSNLHRQILHSELDINSPKVKSAYNTLSNLNSNIEIIPMKIHGNSEILSKLVSNNNYDVVVDGSDNVATRYLLNDICVMNNVPLVSGSALQLEGQLTVYHYDGGPCYRCLFPVPPPPHTVTNCGDGGVLGAVPGVIGVLQALETIKILTKMPDVLSGRFLIFDGSTTIFRTVKLRPRNLKCEVCGENPTIKAPIDYEQFCGASAHDKVINIDIVDTTQQVDVKDFPAVTENQLVIDVRPELEYKMCNLPNTVNYPYTKIQKNKQEFTSLIKTKAGEGIKKVYFLCRRGNDSQRTVALLKNEADFEMEYFNIKGGLHSYAKYVDPSFPVY